MSGPPSPQDLRPWLGNPGGDRVNESDAVPICFVTCRSVKSRRLVAVDAVTASDVDSSTNAQLTYSVSDGNFTVQTVNNIGYIRTAQSVLKFCIWSVYQVGVVSR